MSKRFGFDQHYGERKRARLDITISDHNFPLSQSSTKKDNDQGNWGDDNDDEILLLASQACEQAYNETSLLTDYSICMQPGTTSTQYEPMPSTSKSGFTFKKPSTNSPSSIPNHLKNKFSTIASPLPGMSTKVVSKQSEMVSLTDDLVFNDKICKGQDPNFMYRQLLQLQEENTKLKSENGKLLEKCVTKEGEATILRTQLKTCQVAVDNARLEKIKAQEKVQLEWNDKLAAANNQLHDLRTQLDFKNLEIISIKEKCKKLESTKVKLTQVTVTNNDISSSHRLNSTQLANDFSMQRRRVKVTSDSVQTDDRTQFIILNKISRKEPSKLASVLPLLLETSEQQQYSILDYNEKLQKDKEYALSKCRILSTFHRIPSSPMPLGDTNGTKVNISSIYKDLTQLISEDRNAQSLYKNYFNIFNAINLVLQDVISELEVISKRVTTAFQKEMDEKYIEATSMFVTVNKKNLLKSSALYKDEQAMIPRRIAAITSYVLDSSKKLEILKLYEEKFSKTNNTFVDSINRICKLLDATSCAVLYSGLLLSLILFLEKILMYSSQPNLKIMEIIKVIVSSRPMPSVSCEVLGLMKSLTVLDNWFTAFCPGSNSANLKVDYDQGVLLYRKDSCHFQVLLKQVEASLKCIERQGNTEAALKTTRNLIAIYSNINDGNTSLGHDRTRCDCQRILMQITVYSLRICAVILKRNKTTGTGNHTRDLLALCRSGVIVLYQCTIKDVEFSSQLSHNEGHLIDFCEIVKDYDHPEIYGNMLRELMSIFLVSPEEMTSYHRQPWLKSFELFSLTD